MSRNLRNNIASLGIALTVTIIWAVSAAAQTPPPVDPSNLVADQPVTEDQLTELQNKAIADLPPAGTTNVFFLERFPERIQEFVNPGKYVPLHLQERLSEEIVLKAKGDDKGAERVLRAHLEMLNQMERLGRTKPALAGPFNDTLGQLALCYRKLENDQQDFEAAQQIFNEIRDQNLELAAVINPDVTPPGPILEALTRANVIKPEQVGELKTMEQVVAALRAKRTEVDKANRGTLLAMMEAALARKYLQENANAFVASRMAELTAEATMLRDAIEADNRDTSDAMVNNMMQLAGELGYHEGFGSDPFSQQMRAAIGRFRKGDKVNLERLFEDQFKDTITDRFRALQSGDVINPDYAARYLGIVNRNSGRPDVGIHGFDPERFRRNLTDFGYDPNKFKDYDERQRKMREAGENCYRQNKVPFVKNYENAEIECRDRSYVSGPSPEQYRAKQEECAKQGKGVRWLGGDRLECEGSLTGGPYPTQPPGGCPPGQVYDGAISGCHEPCGQNYGYNPGTKRCEPNTGGGSPTACGPGLVYSAERGCVSNPTPISCQLYEYLSQDNRCVPTPSPGGGGQAGPPITPCGQGQQWEGNGSPIAWRCVNFYNPANSTQCAPGFHWVGGTSSTSSGCWPGSEGGSTSPSSSPTYTYTPPSYPSNTYVPYCGPSPFTPGSGWYVNPSTTCPSGQYPNDMCPTKAKVVEEQANATKYNYSYSYPGTSWSRCPNPPAQ